MSGRENTVWRILARGRMFLVGLLMLTPGILIHGQDIPSNPLSIPVYNPMLINPAYAGSKDYTNISFTTRALKSPDSQVLNIHKRFINREGEYTHIGFGAFLFQEQYEPSWNTGGGVAFAYHYAVDEAKLHTIAGGVTLKGILTIQKNTGETAGDSVSAVFTPDMDAGIYYYGPDAFAGLSVTSLLGEDARGDTLQDYSNINTEYHLYGGYKFILSRKERIVLEPSLLISVDNQTIAEVYKHLVPYLKLYLQNFYIGTYLKDLDTFSLFFQYQFPRLNTGVFLQFPRIGYLNDDNIIFEISLGLNLGKEGPNFLKYRHW